MFRPSFGWTQLVEIHNRYPWHTLSLFILLKTTKLQELIKMIDPTMNVNWAELFPHFCSSLIALTCVKKMVNALGSPTLPTVMSVIYLQTAKTWKIPAVLSVSAENKSAHNLNLFAGLQVIIQKSQNKKIMSNFFQDLFQHL